MRDGCRGMIGCGVDCGYGTHRVEREAANVAAVDMSYYACHIERSVNDGFGETCVCLGALGCLSSP